MPSPMGLQYPLHYTSQLKVKSLPRCALVFPEPGKVLALGCPPLLSLQPFKYREARAHYTDRKPEAFFSGRK